MVYILALILQIGAVLPSAFIVTFHGDRDQNYHWVQAAEKGSGSKEEKWIKGTWPRLYLTPVVRNDVLHLFGAEFTWTSGDGVTWSPQKHDGGWGTRYGAAHVEFGERFWIIGGMKTWDKFENDVWSSEDGLQWELVTPKAPWSARRGHAVFVRDGKMWLIGGAESSGRPDVLPNRSLGDVWVSGDGSTWHQVSGDAPWSSEFSRAYFSSPVSAHLFDGKFWILGYPGGNSIWSSIDGRAWVRETGNAGWLPREGRGSAVFDGKLWVFGGMNYRDVWYSGNGRDWHLLDKEAPWSGRSPGPTVIFKNSLWIFGGKTGRSNDRGDDVWYLEARKAR